MKDENKADIRKEIGKLQGDLIIEDGRMDSIDTKLMDGEINAIDHQRMKRSELLALADLIEKCECEY